VSLVLAGVIFTFQSTAHIGLVREGGDAKSKELSWAGKEFSEDGSFCQGFVVQQSLIILTFLKEEYYV